MTELITFMTDVRQMNEQCDDDDNLNHIMTLQ